VPNSLIPHIHSVTIANTWVLLSQSVTVIGITVDSTLSLNNHIHQSVYFHTRPLRHICPTLTEDTAAVLLASHLFTDDWTMQTPFCSKLLQPMSVSLVSQEYTNADCSTKFDFNADLTGTGSKRVCI